MRLKLLSQEGVNPDGSRGVCRRENTRVINADTGEMLEGVQSIQFNADCNDPASVTIKVLVAGCDVEFTIDDIHTEKLKFAKPLPIDEVARMEDDGCMLPKGE